MELQDERAGQEFKVNGQIVKHYIRVVVNNPREDLFLKDLDRAIRDGQTEGRKIKHLLRGNPMREVISKF